MRLGADALYPTFADEKRKADLPTEERKLQVQQGKAVRDRRKYPEKFVL